MTRQRRLRLALGALLPALALSLNTPLAASARSEPAAKSPSSTAYSIYSAPDGRGSTCSSSRPCALTEARARAASKAATGTVDVHVVLAGGTYELSAPIVLGAGDSGRHGHRVVWLAGPGQHPVFSGGRSVTDWKRTASGSDVWSAPVPATLRTRQLYADGRRLPRTSGPSPVALTQTETGFTAANDTLASWRNPENIEMVFDNGHGPWTQPRCDVASIHGADITMRQPCWSNMDLPSEPKAENGDNPSGGFPSLDPAATPSRLENAFELLKPGTWYLDEKADVLYYQAESGQNVPSMHFVAPVLERLVTTSTTAENPLTAVTFQGIEFAYATWLQPSDNNGFVEMQANMTLTGPGASTSQGLCQYIVPRGSCPFAAYTRPPAAVDLIGTRDVTVRDSRFTHLGSAGLGAYHGARGDLFEGNEVTDVSGTGILFGSVDDADPSAFLANLAERRPARQSSTQGRSTAALAVDGVTAAGGGAQTRLQDDPSWQVDLGATKPLWQVDISARGGAADPGLTDYWVFVSASPFKDGLTPQQQAARPGVWSSHQRGGTDRTASVRTDTSGRYVMVQAAGQRQLSLAEVAVQSGAEIAVGNTIRNNYVHGNGVEFTGAAGIFGGYSRQTTISHNEVGNQSYSGISFGWGGWHTDAVTPTANPNVMADNTISDNLIYRVMGQRTDGGPIYTNGTLGTSLDHGLTTSGNVTFGTEKTSFAFYSDEGSSYTTLDGNVQYADGGNFNGGCSTTGHFLIQNNYTSGARDVYICNRVGNDFRDGGGNVKISGNPAPGEIPAAVLTGAGLQGSYQHLVTREAPELVVVSPITGHKVLLSGSGFSSTSTINVDGQPVGAATYLGPNHLEATLPASVVEANVSVTTAAGTSEQIYTYDPALNAALGKAATQSTTAFNAPAGQAVDGNVNGSYGANSLAHTDLETSPWWQVDLGSDQALRSINAYNRTDCCADRDTDFWVFASSQPFDDSLTPAEQAAQPGVWSSHQSGQLGRPTSLPVPAGTTGRYVMVQLTGTNYLALAEVQVFRQP